jgi:hypothetical protein
MNTTIEEIRNKDSNLRDVRMKEPGDWPNEVESLKY